ncbi:MAG: HU family DNA-binding protein [Nitrospirae bacterium]|nr:HU family DNA-binding protein [Nitrospirota bacterium]
MTKAELIDKIAASAGITKADAARALDASIDAVKAALKKGQKVTLVGFGTFSVSKRKARKGRNPRTGAEIKIAACKVPKFTAGKTLKDAVK